MDIFGHLHAHDYGELHFRLDKATGLRSIIAIHDTRLGPALGGCRFLAYDTDEAAVMIGEYCSRLCALEGFPGHGEQANIRLRRHGNQNVPYAGAAA